MNTVQGARTMASVWVLVATTLLTLHQAMAAPTIKAPWGQIQGLDLVSVSGLNYSAYLAIPYAMPPVGVLRFAKPVAHPGLGDDQVFNATTLGPQCQQISSSFMSSAAGMSEDCLTLNVYVPLSPPSGPKSVMVWIHGGGFLNGVAATYTPSELVTEDDVIVVVIQYRLDVFGFLSSGDDTVKGNFGLWDQNLALRWVKTNIGAFGGDPESMTIFGESAGAASAGLQMLSPASKRLTFRVILQSSTPLAQWPINENPRQGFDALANQTGCLDSMDSRPGLISYTPEAQKRAQIKKALACLRRLDAAELIRFSAEQEVSLFDSFIWLPVVDKDFMPRDPVDLMSDVAYLDDVGVTKRDVMVGVTNDEGAFFLIFEEFNGSFNNSIEGRSELIRNLLDEQLIFLFGAALRKDPQRRKTLINVLEFFYAQVSSNDSDMISLQTTSDVVSDTNYVLNAVLFVRDLAKAKAEASSPGRHYLYLFNHFPAFKADLPELRGTYHAEDLSYEFDPVHELGNRQGFTNVENTIGSMFRTLLASFAKTGTPRVPLLNNQTSRVMWPEFTLTKEEYLSVELVPRVDSRLFGSRVALWTDLIPSLINSTRVPKRPRYRIC